MSHSTWKHADAAVTEFLRSLKGGHPTVGLVFLRVIYFFVVSIFREAL